MRISVLSLVLASVALLGGCGKSTPPLEPSRGSVTQLSSACTVVKTEGETQTFSCPLEVKLEIRQLGNDELTGPACFINNIRANGMIYEVVCPEGQRYNPKNSWEWLGLFYRG